MTEVTEVTEVTEEKMIKLGDKDVTQSEFDQMRSDGKIIFHPRKVGDRLVCMDGAEYTRNADGSLRRSRGLPKGTSKKERRKLRAAAFAAERMSDEKAGPE